MRKSWQEYFMDMAAQVATRSKDPSTQVGCIIVSSDKVVVATGYNGLPRDVTDLPERMQRPQKYLWTSHAEENAVAQAARVGAKLAGGTAYVTHMPCARCARTLIQAGISSVVVGDGVTSMPEDEFRVASMMFGEADVDVWSLNELKETA
jgi:dCMP deaminase